METKNMKCFDCKNVILTTTKGDLITCNGPCGLTFHSECSGLPRGFSKQTLSDVLRKHFICKGCKISYRMLGSLKNDICGGFDELNDKLIKNLNSTSSKHDYICEDVDNLAGKKEGLNNSNEKLTNLIKYRLDKLEKSTAKIEDKMMSNDSIDIDKIVKDISKVIEIKYLSQMDRWNDNFNKITRRIEEIEDRDNNIKSLFDNLNDNINTIIRKIEKIEAYLNENSKEAVNLQKEIDDTQFLENAVNNVNKKKVTYGDDIVFPLNNDQTEPIVSPTNTPNMTELQINNKNKRKSKSNIKNSKSNDGFMLQETDSEFILVQNKKKHRKNMNHQKYN